MAQSWRDPQFGVEFPGAVERRHVVAAADMLAVDKDLRHRGAAAGALYHLATPRRFFVDIELCEGHTLAPEQRLGPRAIGAPHRRVDLDFGHRRDLFGKFLTPTRYGAEYPAAQMPEL